MKKLDLKLTDDIFEEFICENFSEKCKYFLSYFHGKSINSCHTRTLVYLCCIFGKGEENWKRLTYLWPRPLKISSMDLWTLLQFHHHHCSKIWAHLLSCLHNWLITLEFIGWVSIYTKSLVNTNLCYTNFTNTHFQKVPIPWHVLRNINSFTNTHVSSCCIK